MTTGLGPVLPFEGETTVYSTVSQFMNFIVRDFDVSWLAPTNRGEERDRTVGLPLAPVTVWITLSSVHFGISLKGFHCYRAPYCFVPDWRNDVILCFITDMCIISWDQTGVLHWRIPMFVAILSGGNLKPGTHRLYRILLSGNSQIPRTR